MLGNVEEMARMSLLELKALEKRMKTSYDFIKGHLMRRMEDQVRRAELAALKVLLNEFSLCCATYSTSMKVNIVRVRSLFERAGGHCCPSLRTRVPMPFMVRCSGIGSYARFLINL